MCVGTCVVHFLKSIFIKLSYIEIYIKNKILLPCFIGIKNYYVFIFAFVSLKMKIFFLRRKLVERVVSYNFRGAKERFGTLGTGFFACWTSLIKLHHRKINFLAAASRNILTTKDWIPFPPLFDFIYDIAPIEQFEATVVHSKRLP